MVSTAKVALLALLLREAAAAQHTDPDAHIDELVAESPAQSMSLIELVAGSRFEEAEWGLCELLAAQPPGFAIVRAAGDLAAAGAQVHAEALLHAYGEKGKRTRAKWAEEFMYRWSSVRAALRAYEAHGLTKAFGELGEEADEAYMEHNDLDVGEFLERYPVRKPEPVPACARDLVWDG